MESITAKKKFCSDLHRVYWNRDKNKIAPPIEESKKPSEELPSNSVIAEMPKGLSQMKQLIWLEEQKYLQSKNNK